MSIVRFAMSCCICPGVYKSLLAMSLIMFESKLSEVHNSSQTNRKCCADGLRPDMLVSLQCENRGRNLKVNFFLGSFVKMRKRRSYV